MPRIIVSFTSYPGRIRTLNKVLDSIIRQTLLPDKIILYLSSSQFSVKDHLPDFRMYEKYGFEISWQEEDIGPHKKYYYVMKQYPDDIIITIDDDFYYADTMIEELIKYYKLFPGAVLTRRAHLVTWMEDGYPAPYDKWYLEAPAYLGVPRYDLVATTGSGVLYPPHIFKSEIFNKEVFIKKAPYADDLWMKVMELYSEIPVVLVKRFFNECGLENYAETGLCCSQNANGGNDAQLHALLEIYGQGYGKDNILIKRLASDGKLMMADCERVRKSDILKSFDEFLHRFDEQERILVYGAGNVAGKIGRMFEETGRLEKISAFIVKRTEENEKELCGIRVENYKSFIHSSEKILIGLRETKQDEIYGELLASGIRSERIIRLDPFINKLIATF